jgi:hypothetical protein
MVTFSVAEVSTRGGALPSEALETSLRRRTNASIEAGACNAPNLVWDDFEPGLGDYGFHPLVTAAHTAFDQHYPLVLSPDDIWLCIAQGFGLHVNAHAEALRSRLVRWKSGKQLIKVRRDDFVKGAPGNDWPACFAEFSDGIAAHFGKKRDLFVASFSTTGPVEKAASEIALMSAVRPYFDYLLTTLCGIPEVTLLGNPEDWASIRRRTSVLSEFGLGWWSRELEPILDQFVAASRGAVDMEFWRSLYKLHDGSGGPWITGWINVLFPYLERNGRQRNPYVGSWREVGERIDCGPKTNELPSGLSRVDFLWDYLGTEIPMELLAGFVGVSQDPRTLALRPAIGWAVREGERVGSTSLRTGGQPDDK